MNKSPTITGTRRSGGLTGLHVLAIFIGFFLVVFVVNGVMVYKAESTFGGLDTDDAYRKGLAYNERIASADAQAALGWRDRVDYVPETRRLRVSLTDKAGAGIAGLDVSAQIQRATTNRFDNEVVLEQTGPSTYEADLAELDPGWWTVELSARRGKETAAVYEARRRLWIKP